MRNKENMSAEDVAKLLDLPLVTIQRWDHQGKIPSKQIKHKKCFNRTEILQWAKDHDFNVRIDKRSNETTSNQILAPAIKRGGIYYDVPGKDIIEVYENAINQLPFLEKVYLKEILDELLDREELASTGIGNGIAIPHTRERLQLGLSEIHIPVIFLKNKIEFNAIDGNPVSLLFIIFTSNTREHLTVLSRLSQTLKKNELLYILNNKTKELDLLKQINKIEQEFHI
jgi:PTS system nitrogen regulatory IIA component